MAVDLDNADLDRLNALMARTPAPLEPMDAVMIDGWLAGIAVQPKIVPIEQWLPCVFDTAGRALPAGHDVSWVARCRALIERRFEVINTDLADEAWFDPVVVDIDTAPPRSEYESPQSSAVRVLQPWLDGFELAQERFGPLRALDDPRVDEALAAIDTLKGHDDPEKAIDALVGAVARLWAATDAQRHHVQTIRRLAPKVGRNDPCPCGSGRKYKACHGAPGAAA